MSKTKILVIGSIILILAASIYLYAQKPETEEFVAGNPEYLALARKLDELSNTVLKKNAEIMSKLDQVLSNQENILKELAIVKIRASRSR